MDISKDYLKTKYEEAKAGMFMESGPWTVGKFEASSVSCGFIELKDERIAEVQIVVTAIEDNWICEYEEEQ